MYTWLLCKWLLCKWLLLVVCMHGCCVQGRVVTCNAHACMFRVCDGYICSEYVVAMFRACGCYVQRYVFATCMQGVCGRYVQAYVIATCRGKGFCRILVTLQELSSMPYMEGSELSAFHIGKILSAEVWFSVLQNPSYMWQICAWVHGCYVKGYVVATCRGMW